MVKRLLIKKNTNYQERKYMYRLIAIDLDDTFLADDLSIPIENRQSLALAKQKGLYIVFCSGRESQSMKKIIDSLDFMDTKDYYISYNGAMVQTLGQDTLWKDKIQGQALQDMIDLGRAYGVLVQAYADSLVVDTDHERITCYEGRTGIKARRIEDLKTLSYSIKLLFNSSQRDKLEALKRDLEAKFGDRYHYFFSKPEYLEVLYHTSNKGLGVQFLADHLGILASQVICIGDSFNDAYMIKYAGLGVAIHNANPKIKEIADYVTNRTNNQAGVAEVIEKYILNLTESQS